MKYRVEMDISFDTITECLEFIDHVKAATVNPIDAIEPQGPSMTMPKFLRYSECRHDEVPPKPCSGYVTIDLESKTQKVVRVEAEIAAAKALEDAAKLGESGV